MAENQRNSPQAIGGTESGVNFITFDDELKIFDGFEPEEGAEARTQLLEMGLADLVEAHVACDDELAEEEESMIDEDPVLTNRVAARALNLLKDYAIAKGLPEMLKHLNAAESCQQEFVISAKKQSLITDFFDKM